MCGDRLFVPFVYWRGENDIFFCSQCCDSFGQGLTADLIQVQAINKLRGLGYHRVILVRDWEVTNNVEKFLATMRAKGRTE
jgi:hypothetical protein